MNCVRFTLISSGESWDMKFNDCTLKGLVRMQALETCDNLSGCDPPLQKTTISPKREEDLTNSSICLCKLKDVNSLYSLSSTSRNSQDSLYCLVGHIIL